MVGRVVSKRLEVTNLEPVALMTVEEVSRLLRISRAKAYQMTAGDPPELPVVRLGRSVRVRRDRLEAWIEQQTSR